jgi:hypothetical protein
VPSDAEVQSGKTVVAENSALRKRYTPLRRLPAACRPHPETSLRAVAIRDPKRITLARGSKPSPMAGRKWSIC